MDELRSGFLVTPAVRLLRPIGQGGMGKVWVAEHTGLKTEVVVKFMATGAGDNADATARFEREAAVASAVKSPHVVHTYDYGVTSDGARYIVMEKLEGRDLSEHLHEVGKMSPHDVALLVAQVAKALGTAHKVGVIHRDIKPENIFLCESTDGGEEIFVKVLDFGIAKATQLVQTTSTVTGQVVGTPFYMSPEQIVGDHRLDARTDIWSLGVVAFEALTGKRPFDGATIGAITLALHNTKPRITQHLPDAPQALDDWFARMCCHNPEGRFDTARDAANALFAAIGEQNASLLVRAPMQSDPNLGASVPSSGPERAVTSLSSSFGVPKPARKPPVAIVVVAVAAIVGLGIAAVFALRKPDAAAVTPPPPPAVTTTVAAVPPPPPSATATEEPVASAAPVESAKRAPVKPVAKPRPTTTTRPVKKGNDDDIK